MKRNIEETDFEIKQEALKKIKHHVAKRQLDLVEEDLRVYKKKKIQKNEKVKICLPDAVIYCRVSTKEQSLEMQEQKCREYAKEKGYEVKEIVREKSSARSFSKLKKLREVIGRRSNIHIIVYSVDRFCRNTMDVLNVMETLDVKNINIVSVVDYIDLSTAGGRHAFRQRVSAAELESDLISERVKRSVDFKKTQGHIFGQAPYGYKKVNEVIFGQKICKKLEEDQKEKTVKRIINRLTRKRNVSANEVTEILRTELKENVDQVIIYENENQVSSHKKTYITDECICDILNSYELFKRGKLWGEAEIRKIDSEWIMMDIDLTKMDLSM